MKFDYLKFISMYDKIKDEEISNKLGISRTQLWRAKNGNEVGEKFIGNFKKAFPNLNINDYFF